MSIDWRHHSSAWRSILLAVVVFLLFFSFLLVGTLGLEQRSERLGADILLEAVQSAAVECYAIEGMYPPDLAYLETNYGLLVDHSKYIVHYEAFASNILPDIQVFVME